MIKLLFLLLVLSAGIQTNVESQVPSIQLPWGLPWEDDFDWDTLDGTKWCRGDWRAHGCNRHDLRAYRTDAALLAPDNVEFYDDGTQTYVRQVVKLEPRTRISQDVLTETWVNWTYQYSAPSWFVSKTRFKYGYFEARLRLPYLDVKENNLGLGANFWLWENSPTVDRNPESEIDIVEFVCKFPPHTHTCNIHHIVVDSLIEYHDSGSTRLTPNDGQFHTYGAWWGPDFVKFYIDGVYYRDGRNAIPPIADEMIPMQMILDINVFTVSGLETPNANTKIPYNYDIDYVRVYQLDMEQCNLDYINVSPMPALPSVYRTITFGGNGSAMPNGSTKSLTANTSITIQPGFEAPLGAEFTMDIYPYCHPNIVQPCSTCTDCD